MTGQQPQSLVANGRAILTECWEEVCSEGFSGTFPSIPADIRDVVSNSVNSKTKSYRYVLPTQLIAKLVDASLDCRCIQEDSDTPGSFDARSFCRAVVVEFDRANHNVLGGSGDPYVSNPLRIPAINRGHRGSQSNREGFDALCLILDYAQSNPAQTAQLLKLGLAAIRDRLQTVHIVYPVPNRISLEQAKSSLEAYLAARTGGTRMQSVCLGLFRTLGEVLNIFREVVGRHVNASDTSTGSIADLECRDSNGAVVMAVEVKDRQLTLTDVQDKLQTARESGIKELLYLVRGGINRRDQDGISELSQREFSTGQNIYVSAFEQFLESCLILLQERGRRTLFLNIGKELDEHADLAHRQAWRDLLQGL